MANGDLSINITATDRASDKLDEVAKKVQRVGDEEGEVIIKAEIKSAEADLRKLRRQLKEVDGEEAEAKVLADIDRAKSEIKALKGQLDDLDSTVAEPKIEADDAGGAGDDAGGAFGLGAIKGIGAAGIGAAIVSAFNSGMDRIKARAQMVAQFGLIKKDAERLSKEAADIYASNWGDSVGDVSTALGTVKQQLVDVGAVSEDEMAKVAESAIVVSEAFGVDVNQVIRSTSQLLLNGLAPDAESALDMVAQAMQGGANKADDFFDTINEYSQHFGGMGLSAEDMFKIIEHGFANGQRDSDKLADAVKEMRLRMVDEADAVSVAYGRLGLDADEFRGKIASGGPAAREAYVDVLRAIKSVEDPVEQNAIAVELIGTQYEDLGSKAIDSLLAVESATVDATGTVDEMNEGLSNSASELEQLGRKASTVWGKFTEGLATVVNKIVDVDTAIFGLVDRVGNISTVAGAGFGFMGDAVDAVTGKSDELTGSMVETTEAMRMGSVAAVQQSIDLELAKKAHEGTSAAMVQASIDAALLSDATDDVAEADQEATEAAKDRADEIDDLISTIENLYDANMKLVGGELAVETAQINARKAAEEYDLALQGLDAQGQAVTLTEDEKRLAFIEATGEQINAAQAAADYEIAQREAAGATVTSADKNQIMIDKLSAVADTLAPDSPLRAQLLEYIAQLGEVPDDVTTAATFTAPFDEVAAYAAMINGVPGLKETTLRTIRENVSRDQRFQQDRFSHTGSRFAAGETKIVVPGQVFTPDVGGRMSSVEESRRMTSDSGTRRDGPLVQVSGDVIMNNGTDMEAFAAKLNLMVQS